MFLNRSCITTSMVYVFYGILFSLLIFCYFTLWLIFIAMGFVYFHPQDVVCSLKHAAAYGGGLWCNCARLVRPTSCLWCFISFLLSSLLRVHIVAGCAFHPSSCAADGWTQSELAMVTSTYHSTLDGEIGSPEMCMSTYLQQLTSKYVCVIVYSLCRGVHLCQKEREREINLRC